MRARANGSPMNAAPQPGQPGQPGQSGHAPPPEDGPRWGAFSYPAYRRYWLSLVARVFGLQFRIIGVGWLVAVELDRSPLWLGIVGLSLALPTIVGSVPAGIVADRFDHQRIMCWSLSATAVLSLLLAVLILAGTVEIWMVIVWGVAVGSLAALVNPAQAAMLPRLIEMEAMTSAVALSSSVWNSMRIVGPAAAGVLIALIGTGQAFLVTAAGFALSAVLIATLRLEPLPRDAPRQHGSGMWEGMRYIAGHRLFLATVGLSFITSLFGASYQVLLPVFADDILDVGADGFGMLEAAAGVGGLLGTLAIVRVGHGPRSGLVMLAAAGVFGLLIAAFAGSRSLPVAVGLLFAASFAASMYLNIGMTTIQILVPDELRGRVMGVWSMTWFLVYVGGLPASVAAEWIGTPLTVALGGLIVGGTALALFAASAELRLIRELGARDRPAPA